MGALRISPIGRLSIRIIALGALGSSLGLGGCATTHDGSCHGACDEPLAVVAGAAALAGFVAALLLLSDDCGAHVSHCGSYGPPSSPVTNYDLMREWHCER